MEINFSEHRLPEFTEAVIDVLEHLARHNINVLAVTPVVEGVDGNQYLSGYIINFEYQYRGLNKTVNWRKASVAYLNTYSLVDAYYYVLKVATELQQRLEVVEG